MSIVTPSEVLRVPTARPNRALWTALALLVFSVAINYIDRGNLSVAAPLLQKQLTLSSGQLGILLSSFFWTYAAFQLVAGWLVDHYDANWVLLVGFVAWSVATAATGLVGGFASLLGLRLLVGIGESVAYPAYSKIFALHYTESHRGMANSLIDVGCKVGPAIGTLMGGLFIAHFGWRPFFFLLGVGALVWVPFWLKWMPRGAAHRAVESRAKPSLREILRHPSAWGTFAGLFCANYYWYFLLTWLPSYLIHERGFSMRTMAWCGSVPFFLCAASTTVVGWLSLRALQRGASTTRVRKGCCAVGLGLASVIIAVPLLHGAVAAMACLMFACICYGVFTTSHWAITQTIAGPLASGRWTGMQNFVGNLAGIVAPAVTGFVVQYTGHYFWAFAVAAAVALSGALVYIFAIGPIVPACWRCETELNRDGQPS